MRNLNKPPRYNVASIQAQQTLGVNVMQCNEEGHYVEWRDYAWLLTEKQRLDAEVKELKRQPDPLTAYLYAAELAKEDRKKLKAEVERLRKAGIAMGMCLPDTDEANKAYRDFEAGGQS
jgi:catechol-2,3-dioxygenase